jgi:hypothetical protein
MARGAKVRPDDPLASIDKALTGRTRVDHAQNPWVRIRARVDETVIQRDG